MSGRVLITGGAGFIGSHIAEEYQRAGWEVTALDDLSRGRESNVPKGARFIKADIRSSEARAELAKGKYDVLCHHAAQIDVRVSVDRPSLDADINLVGFINLLEGAGDGGVRRVVFASSGGVVYGDPDVTPTPETAPKLPISPYGVSKLSGEHYLRVIGQLRGFEGIALRYSNVFGPRQDPSSEAGVVSIFISRLLKKQKLIIFGDGKQTRDYVFVRDVARANLAAGTAQVTRTDLDSTAFNIATSVERSVVELAETVGRTMGMTPELEFAAERAGELRRNALNISKAKSGLGWQPTHKFDEGLEAIVSWFKQGAP
ncbi:MAG: NAD-dependent epimerase/dehydratase family protein [Gemmatimonadota bacterium]